MNLRGAARFAALSAAALATLCVSPGGAGAAHERVRFAQVNQPTSLNPILLSGYDYSVVTELLFEPLLRLGPDLRWVPALATAEPTTQNGGISPDGKRITFHLRARTQWSDGAPLTSADVKFAVEALLNPKNNVGSRAGFDSITAMRTPDAQTIEFDLKRPSGLALTSIEQAVPLPAHLLRGLPDLNAVPFNASPVGNGPYELREWKRGDHLSLGANSRYWRGQPKIPEIEIRFVPSVKTALLELQTREVDMIDVPPAYVEQVPRDGIARAETPTIAWAQLMFNLSNPALADVRVRKALVLAVDRDNLAKVSGHGLFKTDRLMLPIFQWALDPAVSEPAFDPKAAGALLDQAGWAVGSDGLRHKGSETLAFTMVFGAGGTGIGPATVAADLANLHVRVNQKPVEYELLYDTVPNGGTLATGKYDIAYLSLQTNPDPDASWLFACDQRAPKGFNYAGYCNPAVDAAFARASSTFDRAVRIRALADVQRDLVADAAFAPLFRIDALTAFADWLHGVDPSPYSPFWNVYDWTAS